MIVKRVLIVVGFCLVAGALLLAAGHSHLIRRGIASMKSSNKPLPAVKNPRVLVEKAARRLRLFDGKRLVRTYRIALGRGKGDKVREGDGRTPEGVFYVCVKNPDSKFHLSLGLSYPNVEDAKRGLADELITREQHDLIVQAIRAKRQPPWDTPLGGEIMIHGHGASRDWTAGCVAMESDDVTELYECLPLGARVEIVP